MKRLISIFQLMAMVLVLLPGQAAALTSAPDVFITEVQTSSDNSASDEFIELYNNTDDDIDFADATNGGQKLWKIQYFSSTKIAQAGFDWAVTSPSGSISLTGKIPAHDYYLLSTSTNGVAYAPGSIDPDQTYASPHLADTGGGVRLVDVANKITTGHDNVGWSTLLPLPIGLWVSPAKGGSLQRMTNDLGAYVDDQSVLGQIVPMTSITPKATWQSPLPPIETPPPPVDTNLPPDPVDTPPPVDNESSPVPVEEVQRPTLQITELLPNPAAPATDDKDEFVELYNYGSEPLDVHGFTVQTGTKFSYSYVLPVETVAAHTYLVLTSGQTSLALANSGGAAQLLDPTGQVVDTVQAYGEAPEGQSWALNNSTWQWTTTPTPGSANILTLPAPEQPKTKTTSAKPAANKAAKTTAASTKTGTVKAAKTTAPKTTNTVQAPAALDQVPTLHTSVLAGVGGLALLYGAYEYRTDMANQVYRFRKHRAARRETRTNSQGR